MSAPAVREIYSAESYGGNAHPGIRMHSAERRKTDGKEPAPDRYMLQQDYLLEWRSILRNVLLGLEIRRELTPESTAYAKKLLSQYGLGKFESSRPHELSGGMRQRAALIRTLVLEPDILLLDEPFPHWIIRPGFLSEMTSDRSSENSCIP